MVCRVHAVEDALFERVESCHLARVGQGHFGERGDNVGGQFRALQLLAFCLPFSHEPALHLYPGKRIAERHVFGGGLRYGYDVIRFLHAPTIRMNRHNSKQLSVENAAVSFSALLPNGTLGETHDTAICNADGHPAPCQIRAFLIGNTASSSTAHGGAA